MVKTKVVQAQEVKAGDVLYPFRTVTAVYQMVVGRAYFATYVVYAGGTEFTTFVGYTDQHRVCIHA